MIEVAVAVPSPRDPSPDVVRILREIEETKNPLALYWSPGSTRWQALMWDRNPNRIDEARKMGHTMDRLDGSVTDTLRRVWLMRDGWSLVKEYTESDYTQPSWMRDDLQYLLGRSESTIESAFALGLDIADGLLRERRRVEVWQDYRETDGRLVARVFTKGLTALSTSRLASPFRSSVRRILRKIA